MEFEPIRGLESEMEEFEPSSEAWNRKWRSSSQVLTLGIGNGRVRDKFEARNREWKSSSQVRGLESEMEEFEPSSDAWNR